MSHTATDTSNMWTRCGTDCGYHSAPKNVPTAATDDTSNWGIETQCVNPDNKDE